MPFQSQDVARGNKPGIMPQVRSVVCAEHRPSYRNGRQLEGISEGIKKDFGKNALIKRLFRCRWLQPGEPTLSSTHQLRAISPSHSALASEFGCSGMSPAAVARRFPPIPSGFRPQPSDRLERWCADKSGGERNGPANETRDQGAGVEHPCRHPGCRQHRVCSRQRPRGLVRKSGRKLLFVPAGRLDRARRRGRSRRRRIQQLKDGEEGATWRFQVTSAMRYFRDHKRRRRSKLKATCPVR